MGSVRQWRLALIVISAFIVVEGLPGCDKLRSPTAQEQVQKAKDYQSKGEIRAAIIELKGALQKNPNNAEARWLLGQLYVTDGQGAEAEKELNKAHALGIGEESIRVFLGQALLLQGAFNRVLQEIQPGPQTSAINLAKIREIRGEASMGLGKFEEACQAFQQSRDSDSNYVPAYIGLAKCAAGRKDAVQAKNYLEQALKVDPNNPEVWVLLGDMEHANGNVKAAEAAYQSALKGHPNHTNARLRMASLYLETGRTDVAQRQIDGVLKVAPNNVLAVRLHALLQFRQGHFEQARDELQQLLRKYPDDLPSVLLSGVVNYALGAYEQAETNLSKVVAWVPNNAYARKLLASTLIKTQQFDRALETLKGLLAEDTEDPDVLALAGEANMGLHQFDKATAYFERAAAIKPGDASFRTQLGVSRLAKGDTERAIGDLEAAVGLDSKSYKADMVLVTTHLAKKEFDAALAAIAVLEKKQPNNPVVFNMKGTALRGKGDLVNARKAFEQALVLQPGYAAAAINLAQMDLGEKNPQAAQKHLEAVLSKDKDNIQAMIALAGLAGSQGQEKDYVSWLEKATKSSPSALQPRTMLARYYVAKGEPQRGLVVAREAVTANPRNPDAVDLLGATQFAAGERDNAVATYRQLADMVPNSALAHYKLATALMLVGNLPDARQSLNRALSLKPDYQAALGDLVTLELRSGRVDDALRAARRMQERFPKLPAGYILEGDVLSAEGKHAQAAKSYESAYALGKSGPVAVAIQRSYELAGNRTAGYGRILEWLQANPGDQVTRLYVAAAYAHDGQNPQAIQQYEVLLKQSPQDADVLNEVALGLDRLGDSRALSLAEKAYSLSPRSAPIVDTLGWMLVQHGELKRGVGLLRQAVSLAPKSAELRYHYAAGLIKAGDRAKGRAELEQLLKGNTAFPQRGAAEKLLKELGK